MPLLRFILLVWCGLAAGLPMAAGTELTVKRLTFQGGRREVQVWITMFSPAQHDLRVIDNVAPGHPYRYVDLSMAMRGEGCAAGCNGSFFERYPFVPAGYMISDGVATGTFDVRNWMKGLIVVRGGVLSLEATEGFDAGEPGITQLLQSGPWLVRAGRAVPDQNPLQAARTFIGTDGNGGWFIGMSDDCSLHDLAEFLAGDAMRAVVNVREVLNLDGGPSTGFWVRGARYYHREKWTVRNFIGLAPRQSPANAEVSEASAPLGDESVGGGA